MTKENDSGWNGFVLEKDGKSYLDQPGLCLPSTFVSSP